ncbi:MAG: CoA pyrophosphatase [Shimia sp.]
MVDASARDRLARAATRGGAETSDFELNAPVDLPPDRRLREAAILVLVQDAPRGPEIVLTKRAAALVHHPGQVACPGGKREPRDADLWDTALREATEEIGLDAGPLERLGVMAPHETVTGFRVTPHIGWLPAPQTYRPEPGEVDEVFSLPLRIASDPGQFRIEGRIWRGAMRHYYVLPYGPHYVWGATARILRALAERMA